MIFPPFRWDGIPSAPWFQAGDDRVRLLRDGREAFPAMLAAIEDARYEILVEMYWVGADAVGLRFRDALAARAQAGIAVRVVVDAVGSLGLPARFWEPLERRGGQVHVYHTLSPFAPAFEVRLVERRNHRKVIVVDGRRGFTGGINLALAWLPVEHGGGGFRDDAIEVDGPASEELRALFYKTWQRVSGAKTPPDVLPIVPGRTRPVWVLSSHGQRRRRRGILREYLFRIQRAQHSIDLANAYFVPEGSVRHALYGAVRRGVRVRVLVPFRGDVAVVQFAQESLYESLLGEGLEVYLLRGSVLHAKTAIVDHDFVTTGSYNFDERSRSMNLELNLAVESRSFADHVREVFEQDLLSADRLTLEAWKDRSLVRRGVEYAAFMLRRFL